MTDADIRLWIGYDEKAVEIVDVMAYKGDDFDRIPGATYVEIFPPLHPDAIKLEKHANGTISVVHDDDKWTVIEPRLFRNFRQERNRRLAECDWVVIRATSTDTPIPEEWKVYMQALRDLPSVTEDPANPVWPTPPE